jgi:hypothetical protein
LPLPLNELSSDQFQIDFLTGAATGFNSRRVSPEQWRATAELNRKRSRSLKAIHGQSASWGEISPDVWAQRVPEQAGALEVPVIDLLALGVDADEFGELVSLDPGLERLDSGKEAVAWLHRSTRCVYKLFDLGPEGDLGQRLGFEMNEEADCRVIYEEAELPDILDKLELLHRIGGCPTEIVGLASRGDYLLAKQPFCGPHGQLDEDRRLAVENAKAVTPNGSYGMPLWLFAAEGSLWGLGDLHTGNIRRLEDSVPVIIDAHMGRLSPALLRSVPSLSRAAEAAKHRVGLPANLSNASLQTCDDDEL